MRLTSGNCALVPTHLELGHLSRCKGCGHIFTRGNYVLRILLDEGGRAQWFFLAQRPVLCCGGFIKHILLAENSKFEAEQRVAEIRCAIERGTTANFHLVNVRDYRE